MNNLSKIQISNQIRFPLAQAKGTEMERFAYSSQLTRDLFQKLNEIFITNETDSYITKTTAVSSKIIEDKIQEILPQLLNIKIGNLLDIDKIRPDVGGTTSFSYSYNSNDETYTMFEQEIMMPLTENGKIPADNIFTLLHEFTHVMDYILNPKIEVRQLKNVLNGCFPKNLFHKYINTDEKNLNFFNRIIFNLKLNRQMRKLSDEQKVDILQDMRNIVKSELNAYSNMLKYQVEIDNNLGIDQNLKTDKQRLSEFDFERKLRFLNKKLGRTIKKIRKSQHLHSLPVETGKRPNPSTLCGSE